MTSSEELIVNRVDVSQFDHTPYFCEENVYLLCKKLSQNGIAEEADLFVAFISNEKKQVPLWHQKASKRADGIILWDYHVICIQRKRDGESRYLVWDLDSSLPFPSPLATYVSETIQPDFQLFSDYKRLFRIVHAPLFLHHFASDRRHMKDSAGNWIAQPPAYAPIVAKDGNVHNLNEYNEIHASNEMTDIGMDSINLVFTEKYGVVISENQLEDFFSKFP
ncbi:protein N-terminal glutamine amidohydrolase [Mercurialis annua]|uniref:protein N-terminal glutamine amidohydrolase n=1 Tax=Mercurialis annua TaxID=3986 RepID=UPI002160F7B3|nr:protein N-terminal glutamine amidohydrolase [Mercurialis annua]